VFCFCHAFFAFWLYFLCFFTFSTTTITALPYVIPVCIISSAAEGSRNPRPCSLWAEGYALFGLRDVIEHLGPADGSEVMLLVLRCTWVVVEGDHFVTTPGADSIYVLGSGFGGVARIKTLKSSNEVAGGIELVVPRRLGGSGDSTREM
jgi:hypothetical protein